MSSGVAIVLLCAFVHSSCARLVQYTDELTDEGTGRTLLVRTPATFGGALGFVVGIPFDIAALPATYAVYKTQEGNEGVLGDPLTVMLFPSFVLQRVGTLLAVPFDALEFVAWRAWRDPPAPGSVEQEGVELQIDDRAFPSFPVQPMWPVTSGG